MQYRLRTIVQKELQDSDDNYNEYCNWLKITCICSKACYTTRLSKVGFQTSFRRSSAARGSERSAALPPASSSYLFLPTNPPCFFALSCPIRLFATFQADLIVHFALSVQNEHLSAKHRHNTSAVIMSVSLDPPELGFRRTYCTLRIRISRLRSLGPFTHEVTQLLRLRNPSNDPIAFKV